MLLAIPLLGLLPGLTNDCSIRVFCSKCTLIRLFELSSACKSIIQTFQLPVCTQGPMSKGLLYSNNDIVLLRYIAQPYQVFTGTYSTA